jgi:hypothetical protein
MLGHLTVPMAIVADLFQSQKLVDLILVELQVNIWNTFIHLLPHFCSTALPHFGGGV